MSERPALAVTFDFGQTLAELDTAMLRVRLGERGLDVSVDALEAAAPFAWSAYNSAVRQGLGGHPWKLLMSTLLARAGAQAEGMPAVVSWLFAEQPRANLWRRPIAGMIELVRTLRSRGVPVGVVSNSEGALAVLVDEMGWSRDFAVVADSGALGIEKPDRAIFAWAVERMGVALEDTVHVGDAWAADFDGALSAGMRAVLFRGSSLVPGGVTLDEGPRTGRCEDAPGLAAVLARFGLPCG